MTAPAIQNSASFSVPAFAPDHVPVRRALLSVHDKTGLAEAARRLDAAGVELVSTGGTAAAIRASGPTVIDVADLTGWPQMMEGRVKTLHPAVHGALLAARERAEHAAALAEHQITPIDLVAINLYPFEKTVASGAAPAACIEEIDIGGPAMIRSAAKNHAWCAVCTSPDDLSEALAEIEASGGTSLELRRRLAARAFARTASYDSAIAAWFAQRAGGSFPQRTAISGELVSVLRYGENPHQAGALYRSGEAGPSVASARQVQGKALGYNNIADADAALELVSEFAPGEAAAIAIIKHANPCGVALAGDLVEAWRRALECDPVSAFGGIVAANRPLDRAIAEAIASIFTEVVIAPDADDAALEVFARKKNLRLLLTGSLLDPARRGEVFRSIAGGFLVQDRDAAHLSPIDLKVVTRRAPSEEEMRDLIFAFTIARHVKSNAIVFARDRRTTGIGAGQMNRRDSVRIAALRAAEAAQAAGLASSLAENSVLASDAFFPFADGLIAAADAGARAVIQPGGSIRDDEVIAAADERGLAMVFTGARGFRH